MVFRSFKYRRFSALFLDLVLVSIVTSLLFSNSISNPYYNDYLSISEEYTKVITEVSTVNTQSMDDMQNYINRVSDISYRYSKVNIFYCIDSIYNSCINTYIGKKLYSSYSIWAFFYVHFVSIYKKVYDYK